jgi:hypothetical protein
MSQRKVRAAINGYGVIGKRVADAIALQDDMSLVGISDVATDWRMRIVTRKGFGLYGATQGHSRAMEQAGLRVKGTLEELLGQVDVVVDCTPKTFGAKNAEAYRRAGVKFIVEGGEEHTVAGHSFVAEANYASALTSVFMIPPRWLSDGSVARRDKVPRARCSRPARFSAVSVRTTEVVLQETMRVAYRPPSNSPISLPAPGRKYPHHRLQRRRAIRLDLPANKMRELVPAYPSQAANLQYMLA